MPMAGSAARFLAVLESEASMQPPAARISPPHDYYSLSLSINRSRAYVEMDSTSGMRKVRPTCCGTLGSDRNRNAKENFPLPRIRAGSTICVYRSCINLKNHLNFLLHFGEGAKTFAPGKGLGIAAPRPRGRPIFPGKANMPGAWSPPLAHSWPGIQPAHGL